MPYAWTTIVSGKGTVKTGASVTKGDYEDDDWEYFLDEGIVRDEKYPEDVKDGEAPNTAILRQANEQLEAASQPRSSGRTSKASE